MAHRSRKKHVRHMHAHGEAAGQTHGHATDLNEATHASRDRPASFRELFKGLISAVLEQATARPRRLVERVVAPVRARVDKARMIARTRVHALRSRVHV